MSRSSHAPLRRTAAGARAETAWTLFLPTLAMSSSALVVALALWIR